MLLLRDKNLRRNDILEIRSLIYLRIMLIDFNLKVRYSIGIGEKEVKKSIRESVVCVVVKFVIKGL